MDSNNTVTIISNSEYLLNDIKNMLVLLRGVDKVECYDYIDAEDKIKESNSNVVVLHAPNNDRQAVKLIKKIKNTEETKEIPIILYPEFSSTDFIIEAFDLGISDILSSPIKDYELIVRVIWAIQKSESIYIDNVKNDFLAKLNIIDKKYELYTEEFGIRFLETIIDKARESGRNSCLMLIKTQPAINMDEDKEKFITALKDSSRFNDVICQKDNSSYFVFLSKSKLNGAYSVFERLVANLGPLFAVSATAVEIKNELFQELTNVLEFTLNKSSKNGEITIVKEQDFLDMYDEEEDRLEIAKIFKEDKKEAPATYEETVRKLEDEQVDLGIKIMQEKAIQYSKNPKQEIIKEAKKTANLEEIEIDRRNAVMYKQAWIKKINIVIEPLLKKYAAKFQEKYPTLDANINITPSTSYMKFDKDEIKLDFDIHYDGLKTIIFNISVKALTSVLDSDTFQLEVMKLDYQKFDIILKTLTDEYKKYLQNN